MRSCRTSEKIKLFMLNNLPDYTKDKATYYRLVKLNRPPAESYDAFHRSL